MDPVKHCSILAALLAGALLANPQFGHAQSSGAPPVSGATGICSSGGCIPTAPCVGGTLCETFPPHPGYDPNVQFRKGAAALKAGDYQEAKRLFERALYMAPTNSDVLFALGVADFDLGDLKASGQDFQRALKWNPKHIDAARELAITDIKLGDVGKADLQLALLKKRATQCGGACPEADTLKAAIEAVEDAEGSTGPEKPNS